MSVHAYSGSAVKRSAVHFLIGKLASALLTFITLLWLVRLLTVIDYAAYITLTALFEISWSITNVGLPWLTGRYLPEFRLYASNALMIRFIMQLVGLLTSSLCFAAMLGNLNLEWLLNLVDMQNYAYIARIYLLVLIVEGLGRHLRDTILGALLQQGIAQISLVTRNFLVIIALVALVYNNAITLESVVLAELCADLIGTSVALLGLGHYLMRGHNNEAIAQWVAPSWWEMWKTAKNMYLSEMASLLYNAQIFTLIIRHMLGDEATAVYGFLVNLYRQIMNYLPANLLFGLIRPKLIASYVGDGGIHDLSKNANLIGKLSLFILMLLLVYICLTSETLIDQLSGHKLATTGYYFAGLLLSLIPFSQRLILETVAVATGHSWLCNFGALLGILTLPLSYVLLQLGFNLWAPIIATNCGQLIFNAVIMVGVVKHSGYQADLYGVYKLFICAFIGYLGAWLILLPGNSWLWLFITGIISSTLFLFAAYILKPFTDTERSRLNGLLKHKLFIW